MTSEGKVDRRQEPEERSADGPKEGSMVEPEERSAEEQADAVEKDLDELSEAKRERDEYLELAQRTKAEFENYRKRAAREAEEAREQGKAELARRLIPAIDNLERALQAVGIDPGDSKAKESDDPLANGVLLVYRELKEVLEGAGVEAYDPTGERFDPSWHEALSTRPAADGEDSGVIVETLAKGYRSDGRVLRAARVVVSE
jgi:molecular chaperone GrpE